MSKKQSRQHSKSNNLNRQKSQLSEIQHQIQQEAVMNETLTATLRRLETTLEVRKLLMVHTKKKRNEFEQFHDKAHAVYTKIQRLNVMRESAALATNHLVKTYKGDVKNLQDDLILFSHQLLSGLI